MSVEAVEVGGRWVVCLGAKLRESGLVGGVTIVSCVAVLNMRSLRDKSVRG